MRRRHVICYNVPLRYFRDYVKQLYLSLPFPGNEWKAARDIFLREILDFLDETHSWLCCNKVKRFSGSGSMSHGGGRGGGEGGGGGEMGRRGGR